MLFRSLAIDVEVALVMIEESSCIFLVCTVSFEWGWVSESALSVFGVYCCSHVLSGCLCCSCGVGWLIGSCRWCSGIGRGCRRCLSSLIHFGWVYPEDVEDVLWDWSME